jgi:hypothetical protein
MQHYNITNDFSYYQGWNLLLGQVLNYAIPATVIPVALTNAVITRGNVVDNVGGANRSTTTYGVFTGASDPETMSYVDVFTYSNNNLTTVNSFTEQDSDTQLIRNCVSDDGLMTMMISNMTAASRGTPYGASYNSINGTHWKVVQWVTTNYTLAPGQVFYSVSCMSVRWYSYRHNTSNLSPTSDYGTTLDTIATIDYLNGGYMTGMNTADIFELRYNTSYYDQVLSVRPIFNNNGATVTAVTTTYETGYIIWQVIVSIVIPAVVVAITYIIANKGNNRIYTNSVYTIIENTINPDARVHSWDLMQTSNNMSLVVNGMMITSDKLPTIDSTTNLAQLSHHSDF